MATLHEREGGREGGRDGGSLSWRRKQLEGVCGEVGAGMWLQLLTLKHEGKNWERGFFCFFFPQRENMVCMCVCVCVCVNKRYDGGNLDIKITLLFTLFTTHTKCLYYF